MVNRIITPPIAAYGPFQRTHCSKGGENIENELNLHWDGGSLAFFAIFCPFLPGVSNWASEIGEIATSRKRVAKQLYFSRYIWTGKKPTGSRWEGQKVLFLCLSMFVQNTNKCVCGYMLCKCPGWQWQLFSLSYIVVLVRRLWSLSWFPNVERGLSWRETGAKCNLFSSSRTRWPLLIDTKDGKIESIWSSGDIKQDKQASSH